MDIIFNLNDTKISCTDFVHYVHSKSTNLSKISASNIPSYKQVEFLKENTTLHKHYSLEIQFIIRGNLTVFINEQEFFVEKGNMILLPAKSNHYCSELSDDFERFSFLISFEALSINKNSAPSYFQALSEFPSPEVFPLREADKAALFEIEKYLSKDPSFYNFNMAQAMLTILLLNIRMQVVKTDCIQTLSGNIFDSKAQRKSKIEHYLYTRRNEQVHLKDLATFLKLSSRQTSRIIYDYFQLTFLQLITKIKMEEAKYLIEKTSLPLSTIAESLGYTSYSVFYSTYKKYWGVTPSNHS